MIKQVVKITLILAVVCSVMIVSSGCLVSGSGEGMGKSKQDPYYAYNNIDMSETSRDQLQALFYPARSSNDHVYSASPDSPGKTVANVWNDVTHKRSIPKKAVELTEKLLGELNFADVVLNNEESNELYSALDYYLKQFSSRYSGEKAIDGYCYSLAWLISNALTNMRSGEIQDIDAIRESYSTYFDDLLVELNIRIAKEIGDDDYARFKLHIDQMSKWSKELFMLYVENLNKDVLYPYFKAELQCDESKLIDRTLGFSQTPGLSLDIEDEEYIDGLQFYYKHLPTMAAYNLTVVSNFDKLKHSDVWGTMDCQQVSRQPIQGEWPYDIWYLPLTSKK